MSAMENTAASVEDTSAEVREQADVSVASIDRATSAGYMDRPLAEFREQHSEEFLEPMARPQRIEPFSDPESLVERINPDFGSRGSMYDVNCADCARSFERSWRGFLEEAAGRAPQIEPGSGLQAGGELSEQTEEWSGEKFRDAFDPSELRARLEAGGHGSSAIVHTQFVDANGNPGGHAFNVVNSGGEVRVCDAQTHETFSWDPVSIRPELGPSATHRAVAWNANGERIW